MSSELAKLIAMWGIGAVFALMASGCTALTLQPSDPKRRLHARLALTCWAWPIWSIAFAVPLIRQLIAIATKETK